MSQSDYFVLVGPPNSGKTTLFNWITGYKKQTVNYPGSTVDVSFGLIHKQSNSWKVVDTPGIYSFSSPSPEKEVVQNILKDSIQSHQLRGVILVLDATRLERQLPLVFQLKSSGVPFVLALSMYDIQKKQSEMNLSLLSKKLAVPVYPIEGLLGGGVTELLDFAKLNFNKKVSLSSVFSIDWSKAKQERSLEEAKKIVDKILIHKIKKKIGAKTQLLDKWLLHPFFGFGFLCLILFIFFSGIFWLAQPMMDLVDSFFTLGVEKILSWSQGQLLLDFLANGVLTSFGAFFVFVPQVFILFVGVYLLEDSGYLARAVTLVDGPFSRIGLSGKSLFPFLSGFACAIPATLATRSISSKREKWITIFVLPFMTCSARLPVYALLLSFLFYGESAWKPGLIMSFIYFLSLILGIAVAGLLNVFLKKEKHSSFVMELPLYRRPIFLSVLSSSWSRTKHFIKKAGPVIFVLALIMWVATNFPRHSALKPEEQIQKSYAGQFGQLIEPVFEQMGGDWRIGVSLLSAFVAREVFVSVLAVTLKNTESQIGEGNRSSSSMVEVMKKATFLNGKPLFSTAMVLSLLVFFMISLQCLSTTGIVYKETGSWKFAVVQLVSLNLVAYIAAVFTYSIF